MDYLIMIDAFRSNKPLPELAEKLQFFGQFVGSWDADVMNYNADGTIHKIEAEWHFDWVLEERAETRDSRFDGERLSRRLRHFSKVLRPEDRCLARHVDRSEERLRNSFYRTTNRRLDSFGRRIGKQNRNEMDFF